LLILLAKADLPGQVDPYPRQLIQAGYSQPLQGLSPFPGYAFYYLNQPDWPRTNQTLRLAVAPVYLDAELAFRGAFGPRTDLALGVAGGGYADSYAEVRGGKYVREESFKGHSAGLGVTLHHRFNPASRLPLHGILRGSLHQSFFYRDDRTAAMFVIPEDLGLAAVRAGLRLGGTEPLLLPELGLEISAWYEGQWRTEGRPYGYAADRHISRDSHRLWGRTGFSYLTEAGQRVGLAVTGGTSLNPDRFNAFRLGSWLPLNSEFPLNLPGYYYHELSAQNFLHASLQLTQPLDHKFRWSLLAMAATAVMDYTPGVEQPGKWHTGLGGGVAYHPPSRAWQIIVAYGYGLDALRKDGRGAQSLSVLAQFDFRKARSALLDPAAQPARSRGLHDMLRRLF